MAHAGVMIVELRATPLEGCSVAMDGSPFYSVEIFVPVASFAHPHCIEVTLKAAQAAMSSISMSITEISKIILFDADEWSVYGTLNQAIRENAEAALHSGKLRIGAFRSFEVENLCQFSISHNYVETENNI